MGKFVITQSDKNQEYYFNLKAEYGENGVSKNFSYSGSEELKRSWNLARTLEHEWLGHATGEIPDVLEWRDSHGLKHRVNPMFSEKEFRESSGNGDAKFAKTAMQVVNEFRVEMGLENFQRLHYDYIRLKDGKYGFIFGNPDDDSPLYMIISK